MASGRNGAVLRQVHALFGRGIVAGMDVGLLLERFVARRDEPAFEALIARFGPMVLGICRRMLDDPRDVEDAFQATFLIFVRKAATIRDGELLGNWLYGVAYRVASRARLHGRRRRSREVAGVEWTAMATSRPDDGEFRELSAVLDEELAQLPGKYRDPIVLCCLQGHTYDEAAVRLRCPIGTVRSRLAGARKLLRARLAGRGVVVPAGGLAAALAPSVTGAAVPPALCAATIRAALGVAGDGAITAGAVSTSVLALTREVMRGMLLIKMGWIAGLSMILAAVAGGWAMAGQPADDLDRLRTSITRMLERNKALEARDAMLTRDLSALAEQLRSAEDRLRTLAKPVETAPDAVASTANPEVVRSVGKIVDQLQKHPLRPPVPRAGLFLLDTATAQVRRIVDEPDAGLTWCGSPSWSWDGTRILFDVTPGNNYGATRLKAIDLADSGSGLTDLGPGNCPSLSPDGRSLAIMDNRGGCVTVMHTDGTNRHRAGRYGRPNWSPDGRQILVAGIRNPFPAWLVNPEGDLERPVEVEGQTRCMFPSWVNATTIVAVIGPDNDRTSIALLDITEPSEARVKEILWKRGGDSDVRPSFPVYSADTGRLVFAGSEPKEGMTALYLLRRGQAGQPRRLEPDVNNKNLIDLARSPDGRYVLFCSDRP